MEPPPQPKILSLSLLIPPNRLPNCGNRMAEVSLDLIDLIRFKLIHIRPKEAATLNLVNDKTQRILFSHALLTLRLLKGREGSGLRQVVKNRLCLLIFLRINFSAPIFIRRDIRIKRSLDQFPRCIQVVELCYAVLFDILSERVILLFDLRRSIVASPCPAPDRLLNISACPFTF